MKQSTRTFLAIHKKSRVAYSFKNRAHAIRELALRGQCVDDYELWYAYSEMARKPYSAGYEEAHRRAAREYWRRTSGKGYTSRGRPKKDFGHVK